MHSTDAHKKSRIGAAWRKTARAGFWIVAVVVLGVAMIPGNTGLPALLGWDKLNHLMAFFVLTVFARLGWPNLSKTWLLLMLLSYGVAVEILQTLPLVGRSADIMDVVANAIGLGLGFLVAPIVSWVLHRQTR